MTGPRPDLRLPDFLCIGSQRSGTTWLYKALSQLPGVWMPLHKEIGFFHRHGPAAFRQARVEQFLRQVIQSTQKRQVSLPELRWWADLALATDEELTIEWYGRLFAPAGDRRCGDITPDYCRLTSPGIERIREHLGTVPIVLLLRDPLDRAMSQLAFHLATGMLPRNVSRTEMLDFLTSPERSPVQFNSYTTILRRWEAVFGAGAVHVGFYDHFLTDAHGYLAQICAHVGVDLPAGAGTAMARERVNPAPREPVGPEIRAAAAQAYLPELEPLVERFPDPVAAWHAHLVEVARGASPT